MEARKPIFCGLSARGIIPPLPQEDTDDDVADITPTEVEVVEISDEEEEDMVELSFEEYREKHGEEKKLREEKFKVLNSGIKLEVGQSSKGDGHRLMYAV
ncbi:hypothetical protein HID58_041392 [Brassica napus]|uniref:Uncharacterized protein n=1 Tax=Brassica napus TaxID=3708 RepID=A0ABQ8BAQ9_BRANA|nr:hypothetical protein HID58_041392 [Brassica napus]